MVRIFDRLSDFMIPGEWYTTMELSNAISADNGNVYKVLKKSVRDGFMEKGPNRRLPWGEAATWRMLPPSERSRSRNRNPRNPLHHPYQSIVCVIHLYQGCITETTMT